MAFFCFRKKLPWSKTNHYNCNGDRQRNKPTKAGAIDDDFESYESINGMKEREKDRPGKHVINQPLNGSLRRSKKKSKKLHKQQLKINEKAENPYEIKDERTRLASMLDNSNENSQVEIVTTLVDSFGPTDNCKFEVIPGEKVVALYREGDFIKVTRFTGETGFVPVRICFLVAEKAPVVLNDQQVSNPLAKSDSSLCNGIVENSMNDKNSNISYPMLSEPPLCPEVADGAEVDSGVNNATNKDVEIEDKQMKSSLSDANDFECDSLARRVKRHEIRQLLKRETEQKINSSDTFINVGTNVGTNMDSPNPKASIAVDSSVDHITKGESTALEVPSGNNEVVCLQQVPSLHNSSLSLDSRTRNGVGDKTDSKLSLNSIQKETRSSQQSLSSFKARTHSRALPNGTLLNVGQKIGLSPRFLGDVQQLQFDSRSLNSYDGSLHEVDSRLNGGDLYYSPPMLDEGCFYSRDYSPKFIGQKALDLENENSFLGGRRWSSLRRGSNYAWVPHTHLNGYGHGRFVDGERAWQYFAEGMPIPGSRIISSSFHENPHIISDSRSLVDETIMFAMRDFQAVEKDELNMRKGERVSLIRKESEDWWWVVNNQGETGLVPSYFLIPLLQPSRQDFGSLNDSSYGVPSKKLTGNLHTQPYLSFGAERKIPEMEHERKGLGRTNGLARSNTIGSNSGHVKKGSTIDWRNLYNNENGPRGLSRLKDLTTTRERIDDVKSKEELLNRIRNEVMKDPMKELLRKRSLSNESMHKISRVDNGIDERSKGTMQGISALEKKDAVSSRDFKPGYSKIAEVSHNQQRELPSYDECMDKMSRDQISDTTRVSDVVNSNSELFETPRILRRRMTYTGGSARKARPNAVGHKYDEKLAIGDQNGSMKHEVDTDRAISTWC